MRVLGHNSRKERRHTFGDPLLVEEDKTVRLLCGHMTTGVSTIVYPNGRRAYYCPQGCGIVKASTSRK